MRGKKRVGLAVLPGLGLTHAGCRACTPNITPPDEDTSREDTSSKDTQETGMDSGETGETGEPPPCDQPEVEPNGTESDAQLLSLIHI